MADNYALVGNTPNFAGVLFRKGRVDTPFSTLIGGSRLYTRSNEFVVGQTYAAPVSGAVPARSENDSLVAPNFDPIQRDQITNVTQIFDYSVGISFARASNGAALSGANIAGQQANPVDELAFQTQIKMMQAAQDIENTFINGVYHKSTGSNDAAQTRGIVAAITKNVKSLDNKPLSLWDIAEMLTAIGDAGGVTSGLVLLCESSVKFQLCAEAEENNFTVMTEATDINGINITMVRTPKGDVRIAEGRYLPSGTALLLNISVIHPVEQPVIGMGNFFLYDLSRSGAGNRYGIYGQIGLDHGPADICHAKFTDIMTGYQRPRGKKIFTVEPIQNTEVLPTLADVTLAGAQVGTATDALAIEYNGQPTADPTLTYQWEIGNAAIGTFTAIDSATSATYTPVAGDEGKFIRCKVTASGKATGTKISNSKKVAASA